MQGHIGKRQQLSRRTAAVVGIALIAVVAWSVGRASAPSSGGLAEQAPSPAGYDLSLAVKSVPTGTLREFHLVSRETAWENTPGVTVPAITYDGQDPGPLIRVTEGDTLRVTLKMGAINMDYFTINYLTINGKACPSNENWMVREGDPVRVINISNLAHPMHLHGHDFTVIAKDGEPIRPALQQMMNTLTVNAGETYDVAFRADNPGTWVWHCHELHHTENGGVEPGGLIQVVQYEGVAPPDARGAGPAATPTRMPANMPGMRH